MEEASIARFKIAHSSYIVLGGINVTLYHFDATSDFLPNDTGPRPTKLRSKNTAVEEDTNFPKRQK